MRILVLACFVVLSSAFSAVPAPGATSQDFTLIQLGDLQYQTNCPGALSNLISYIVAGAASNNLQHVILPGDLADDPTIDTQYVTLTNQLWRLRMSGVPVFAVPGNHDYIARQWEKYLSPLLLTEPGLAETFIDGKSFDGIIVTQNVSGLRLAFVGVQFNVTNNAALMTWMRTRGAAYPDRDLIYVVHGYLSVTTGLPMVPHDHNYLGGDKIWANVINVPNAIQVMCGHDLDYTGAVTNSAAMGSHGNVIQEFLFNYQWGPPAIGQATLPQCGCKACGATWLRQYRWQPSANLIGATSYDTFGGTNDTSPRNQFTVPIHTSQ